MSTIEHMIRQAEAELTDAFARIDENETARTRQILDAFRQEGVSYRHFAPSTGYGYDDISRNTLERIYAAVFHTEAALMRPHVASGTAALSLTLFGMTRPGEKIVSATGMPYDTLQGVIGIGEGTKPGSLKEMGVDFECVELKDGKIDVPAVEEAITENTTLVIAQRSRGYAWRPSLFPAAFEELAEMIHTRHSGVTLMVDNCYGEFVCEDEPTDHGADLVVGSLASRPPADMWQAGRNKSSGLRAGLRLRASGGKSAPTRRPTGLSTRACSWRRTPWRRRSRPRCWQPGCSRTWASKPHLRPRSGGQISSRQSKCSPRSGWWRSARGSRPPARWTAWPCRNPGICPAMTTRL